MGINIGLDIGAISLKLAALGRPGDRAVLESLCATNPAFRLSEWDAPGGKRAPLVLSDYRRIAGSPIQTTYDVLHEFYEGVPESRIEGIRVTGSGSRTIAKILGLYFENEFKAIARMMGLFHPRVKTVFEIGGQSSKYIRLDGSNILDYDLSGECAAGTGSFLDQQALRMQYSVEEVGGLVCQAGCSARIAGRCSVFAKSDMIHAQQKGYAPAEILRGLCDAVARNYKSSIVKGRLVESPVALIGAVALNNGVAGAPSAKPSGWSRTRSSSPSITPGAAPSAPPCWRPRRRASAACAKSTAWRSTNPNCACRIPRRSRWPTSCCCATACRSTCRRRTTRPSPLTSASISARFRPTWW